jgi:hypothetical protein
MPGPIIVNSERECAVVCATFVLPSVREIAAPQDLQLRVGVNTDGFGPSSIVVSKEQQASKM